MPKPKRKGQSNLGNVALTDLPEQHLTPITPLLQLQLRFPNLHKYSRHSHHEPPDDFHAENNN